LLTDISRDHVLSPDNIFFRNLPKDSWNRSNLLSAQFASDLFQSYLDLFHR